MTTPPPKARRDAEGRLVTEPAVAAALDAAAGFEAIVRDLHAVRDRVLDLAAGPHGREVRARQIETDLRNAATALRFAKPYTTCPMPDCGPKCPLCRGQRWITKEQWRLVPEALRSST